jgi:hypothetical protein
VAVGYAADVNYRKTINIF